MIVDVLIHKPLRTGNIWHSINNAEGVLCEKNWLKTKHYVDINDYMDLFDNKTGGRIIMNKISALGIGDARKNFRLQYENEVLKTALGSANNRILELEAQKKEGIESELDRLAKIHKAVAPLLMKPNKGYGGNYGRNQ
jgi:hypothetical protein